jgi:O-antigen biosynthesis protein WbqP
VKRVFDLICSLVASFLFAIPMAVVALLIKFTSPGPILYWSDRVGRNNAIFKMPKFRTMRVDTPALATHLLTDPARWLTPVGKFLRKSSLDELPQLWSILVGHMSIVGPRPALFNQHDLIALRTAQGVHQLRPGLTGWAQINGRDELPIPQKVELDAYYLAHRSFRLDLRIILLTVVKVLRADVVKQRVATLPVAQQEPAFEGHRPNVMGPRGHGQPVVAGNRPPRLAAARYAQAVAAENFAAGAAGRRGLAARLHFQNLVQLLRPPGPRPSALGQYQRFHGGVGPLWKWVRTMTADG